MTNSLCLYMDVESPVTCLISKEQDYPSNPSPVGCISTYRATRLDQVPEIMPHTSVQETPTAMTSKGRDDQTVQRTAVETRSFEERK
jgi:hypothetical protein